MSNNKDRKVIHSIRTEVDSFGRKKYKLQEVAHSGSEEQEIQNHAIIDTGRHKSMLIGREEGLNIQKYIGKIETNKKIKKNEVFYCDVCSEGFKCDMAYLTHLNSPAHNRKIGMNMKVKNVPFQTVSSKISALMNKKQQKQQEQQEKQLIKQIQNGHTQLRRPPTNRKPPLPQESRNDESQNQNDLSQSQHNDDNEEVDENQDAQNAEEQHQEVQQQEEDSNELAEMQMMQQMGFANSFGSKKNKW